MNLYFLLSEFVKPINCVLISENVPTISIVLSERRSNSLKGFLKVGNTVKGNFYTHRSINEKPASCSFEMENSKFNGEMILLKDEKIWHPYQSKIKSYEVNKVLFSGLTSELSKISNENDLLKATSDFFKIGNECYGGRIKKV